MKRGPKRKTRIPGWSFTEAFYDGDIQAILCEFYMEPSAAAKMKPSGFLSFDTRSQCYYTERLTNQDPAFPIVALLTTDNMARDPDVFRHADDFARIYSVEREWATRLLLACLKYYERLREHKEPETIREWVALHGDRMNVDPARLRRQRFLDKPLPVGEVRLLDADELAECYLQSRRTKTPPPKTALQRQNHLDAVKYWSGRIRKMLNLLKKERDQIHKKWAHHFRAAVQYYDNVNRCRELSPGKASL